jgi:hypothetical protein
VRRNVIRDSGSRPVKTAARECPLLGALEACTSVGTVECSCASRHAIAEGPNPLRTSSTQFGCIDPLSTLPLPPARLRPLLTVERRPLTRYAALAAAAYAEVAE